MADTIAVAVEGKNQGEKKGDDPLFQTALPKEGEEKVECFPVICELIGKGDYIPAVKLVSSGGPFGVFPLSRAELGSVWCSDDAMWPWRVKSERREWAVAEALCCAVGGLPCSFSVSHHESFAKGFIR